MQTTADAGETDAAQMQAEIDRLRRRRTNLVAEAETNRRALAAAIQRRNAHIRSAAAQFPKRVLISQYRLTRQRINQIVAEAAHGAASRTADVLAHTPRTEEGPS